MFLKRETRNKIYYYLSHSDEETITNILNVVFILVIILWALDILSGWWTIGILVIEFILWKMYCLINFPVLNDLPS